jgi:hypothetical protein
MDVCAVAGARPVVADGRDSAEHWAQAADIARRLHDETPWYRPRLRAEYLAAEAYAISRYIELMED